MAFIHLPQRWSRQPPHRVEVDRSHPLAEGLVACWMFNEGVIRDLIQTTHGKWNGTASFGYDSPGMGAALSSGNNLDFSPGIKSQQKVGNGDYTLAVRVAHTDTAGTQNYYRKDIGIPRQIYLIRSTGTNIEFGDGVFTSITAAVPTLTEPNWFVGTRKYSSGDHRLYFNGKEKAAGTFNANLNLETGGEHVFGYDPMSGPNGEAFVGVLFQLMIYNVALPAHKVAWLNDEPYAFLRPLQRRIYVHVAAAPPPPPPVVQTPENSVLLVPDFAPGPAPRFDGKMDPQVDRNFQVLAKLATLNPHLNDVQEWLAEVEGSGDEAIDIFDFDGLTPDEYLFGRTKWRRNR